MLKSAPTTAELLIGMPLSKALAAMGAITRGWIGQGHRVLHAHCLILRNHCNIFSDENQPLFQCFQGLSWGERAQLWRDVCKKIVPSSPPGDVRKGTAETVPSLAL